MSVMLLFNRVPKPVAVEATPPPPSFEVPPEEVQRVARKLGLVVKAQQAESPVNQFKRFLADNGIRVYPLPKVEAFLGNISHDATLKARKRGELTKDESYCPVWRPLAGGRGYNYPYASRARLGPALEFPTAPYSRPIPYPVMLTAEKIKDAFPYTAFYVSDYAVTTPDPFLMVEYAGSLFVIEHWDEPTFLPFLNGETK